MPATAAASLSGEVWCALASKKSSTAPQSEVTKPWNFQGFVTSDCGAVDDFFEPKAHHTSPDKDAAAVAGIEAGTDTNCGKTYLALTDAVKKGLITEAQIDVSLKRLFTARMKLGMFDPPEMVPAEPAPSPRPPRAHIPAPATAAP